MENLIFSLNATIPIFLLMIFGTVLKRTGLFSDSFVKTLNSFVFNVSLPATLFYDLSGEDFFAVWDMKFVIFCFTATALSITAAIVIAFLLGDRTIIGEFAQASYRSSAALLGIGFIQNIYGDSGMAPLMIVATVPLYNIMAVVLLSVFKPEGGSLNKKLLLKTLKGIITNPMIVFIFLGMLWSILKLPRPTIAMKTVKYLANTATPMGLMALGAAFDIRKAFGRVKPALIASALKLVAFCAIFLPMAIALGFREDKLVAILIMLGSPSTVSCFIMAKNMGHDGTLSSSTIMLTTLLSAFTLTGWLYMIKTLGLI